MPKPPPVPPATDYDLVILDRIDGMMKKIRFREKIPIIGDGLTTRLRLDAAALIPLLTVGGVREFHERRRENRADD
jgi:hypothetical protein